MDKAYTLIVAIMAGIPNGIVLMVTAMQLSGLLRSLPKRELVLRILTAGTIIGLSFHFTRAYLESYALVVGILIVLMFSFVLYSVKEAHKSYFVLAVFTFITTAYYLGMEMLGDVALLQVIHDVPDNGILAGDIKRIIIVWFFDIFPKIILLQSFVYHNFTIAKWFNKIE